jgi:3-hydroxybutyrate dehydrogenase
VKNAKDSIMDLTGKTILVTGAGSGIGRAIAEAFSASKARVFLHDIEAATADLAEKMGAEFLPADLSDPASVRELGAVALQRSAGRIDILVNNAGFQHVAKVGSFPKKSG